VRVGAYTVLGGGTSYLQPEDYRKAEVLVALTDDVPSSTVIGGAQLIPYPMVDYGGVPTDWSEFLQSVIDNKLKHGKRVLAFCFGSHGRTGTFLASLIALLESEDATPDPIAAVRERHCRKAVETREQAEAVFALRGRLLPERYLEEFPAIASR
jgi:protein-tyrosine phosphatase